MADKSRKAADGPNQAPVEAPDPAELLGDADPYELVRAKDEFGNQFTTTRIAALNAAATILDKPAVDSFGQIVPNKTALDLKAESSTAEADQPSTDHSEE